MVPMQVRNATQQLSTSAHMTWLTTTVEYKHEPSLFIKAPQWWERSERAKSNKLQFISYSHKSALVFQRRLPFWIMSEKDSCRRYNFALRADGGSTSKKKKRKKTKYIYIICENNVWKQAQQQIIALKPKLKQPWIRLYDDIKYPRRDLDQVKCIKSVKYCL